MTKQKKKGHLPPIGGQAKQRHERHDKFHRSQQHDRRVWSQLNALKEPAKIKHKSYFEAVDNTEKKKKLEFEVTTEKEPPPGFEFVPTGNPELTTTCKEMSREQDAMIFIVSDSKDVKNLEHHMHRAGYHFRRTIVDEARKTLERNGINLLAAVPLPGEPESIPQSQQEINMQADAVLRDLFPRIPNTDRQEIILHAFQKNSKFNGEYKVGMASELPLARRVQLAALAHIRHTHTRYDKLLRETTWANARKAVEQTCLDVIVKWRGDEETGRDQLDEILREVIEISDSEDGSEDESSGAEAASAAMPPPALPRNMSIAPELRPEHLLAVREERPDASLTKHMTPGQIKRLTRKERKSARKAQRFRRYAAVAEGFSNDRSTDEQARNQPNGALAPSAMERARSVAHLQPGVDRGAVSGPLEVNQGQHQHQQQPVFTSDPSQLSPNTPIGHGNRSIPAVTRYNGGVIQQQPSSFIRVRESTAPKVGSFVDRLANDPTPLSPVRHGLEDMLLPSIEPVSPNRPVNIDQGFRCYPSVSQSFADIPRVVSRTVAHEPVGYARRGSPVFNGVVEDASRRRHMLPQYPGDAQALADAGFIRIVREPARPVQYMPEVHGDPYRVTPGRHLQRPRSPIVYAGDAAYPTQAGGPLRSRANPIVIDSPYSAGRGVDAGGPLYVGNDRQAQRRVAAQDSPSQEIRRLSGGPRVVYLEDEPSPRARPYDEVRPPSYRYATAQHIQPVMRPYEAPVYRTVSSGHHDNPPHLVNERYHPQFPGPEQRDVAGNASQGQRTILRDVTYDTTRNTEPYQTTARRTAEYYPEELRYGHNVTPGHMVSAGTPGFGHPPQHRQPVNGGPY
ncbi:hypothetical protein PG997_000478 [Apiospora hydei]|uniref:DUF2293 domain-containing protein n=1 Tax=Apiospora hydei TaxID=1337664 RepID=A0ABR1XB14_9PEZI